MNNCNICRLANAAKTEECPNKNITTENDEFYMFVYGSESYTHGLLTIIGSKKFEVEEFHF